MKIIGGRYRDSAELRELGVGAVGEGVLVHETAQLVDAENIRLGFNVRIDPFCILSANRGHIHIGNHVHIAAHADIFGGAGVTVEDFAGLSQGVRVYSVSDDYSGAALTGPTVPRDYTFPTRAAVSIGRHAIIGSGSVILPGVEVGEGCAVGALSLVSRSLEPWGIYAGAPAKLIKARQKSLLQKEAMYLRELSTC